MNITLIAALVSGVLSGALGYGAAWEIQGKTIANLKLEHSQEIVVRAAAQRAAIDRTVTNNLKAQNEFTRKISIAVADAKRAESVLGSLRSASTDYMRSPTTDNSCTEKITTYDNILLQCGARLVEVAKDADEWVTQAVTLQEIQ